MTESAFRRTHVSARIVTGLTLMLAACGGEAKLSVAEGTGPNPILPEPESSFLPTVNVAEATPWPEGTAPVVAEGLEVVAFAEDLDHPRWIYVLPNGDVLVAETNGPKRPEDTPGGIKGWFMDLFMRKAGAGVPSANRITLLRDADGDGVAEERTPFLEDLNSPFGMALIGDNFYVANTDAVVRFPYQEGATAITEPGGKLTDLPGGLINHHWTKSLVASPDGSRLYSGVGSNSNVQENGDTAEYERAAILEIDVETGMHTVFASGLRNPVGIAFEPTTGVLWTSVNERDELGPDLVPDYMTSVQRHGFYGWPYSYYGEHIDERVEYPRPDLVAKAIVPDYALGSHTASLGLTFSEGAELGPAFAEGAFVGQHGSWNRKPRSGYRVIFVPFSGGMPSGEPIDVLTGFLNQEEDVAYGRPVGVAIDKAGALLVADDVGNIIWRVSAASAATAQSAAASDDAQQQ